MLPTPTPFPDVAPAINLDAGDYRIWQFADDAIQVWNFEPNFGLMVQVAIVAILVVGFVTLLIRLIQEIMSEE